MFIVLALVVAAAIGLALHWGMPGRDLRGAAVAPLFAAGVAGVVWTALTWAGLSEADLLLWLIGLAVPAALTVAFVAALTRVRSAHDARERARLGIG
ncbi:hypothetical protein RYJ27_03630 [Microbacterium limosum]|uniref:Uncharacterized protein n=1 Tax=Microbacterium limosum TaxID=3079935 RepID=A0AAU0MIH8_9MICO|nr:hypothetical protein [Microbacterium sp. Y20]WOQ70313.1 hypothetical protein RYJ27_03630 [Microbacterium sp. Y20]